MVERQINEIARVDSILDNVSVSIRYAGMIKKTHEDYNEEVCYTNINVVSLEASKNTRMPLPSEESIVNGVNYEFIDDGVGAGVN